MIDEQRGKASKLSGHRVAGGRKRWSARYHAPYNMSNPDVDTLKQAILALYGADDKARVEANAWLMAFAASPAAWEAARGLLADPAEQVQYFGANLIFMKVRAEWHSMPDENKHAIYTVVKQLIGQLAQQPGAAQPPSPGGATWTRLTPAGKRLCLTLAAAAVRSSMLEAFTNEALSMAADPLNTPIAVELLIALPQEILERNQAAAADKSAPNQASNPRAAATGGPPAGPPAELRAVLPQVISLLSAALTKAGPADSSPAAAECTAACLHCLREWLSLGMGCSLLMLLESAPSLLGAAVNALASQNSALSDAAADALCELMVSTNTVLNTSAEKAIHATHALSEQLTQVVQHLRVREEIASNNELDERQFNACRVLCAFAERGVDVVAQTDGRLVPLVELVFCFLGGELRVADLTIDFWSGLQDTPLHLRHEQLREPLFRQVAQRLMQRCRLPPTFTSWEAEDDVDQDEFERFREQSAQEIFSSCLQLLHAEFVATLEHELSGGGSAPTWQSFELVLYITRCLHAELKTTLGSEPDGSGLPAPLLAAHKDAVRSLLLKLLAPAANNGQAFDGQPAPLLTAAVRLYGSFGKWLAKEQPHVLEGCVHCVLKALLIEESGEHAAVAFRALCVHAQKHLGRVETVHALLGICEPAMRNASLTKELRVALVEGLARLVASLTREEQAQQALAALVSPPCQLLQQDLASLPPGTPGHPLPIPKEQVEAVAVHLELIASSIRFCDRYKPERHPVLPVLQGCWPLLMEVAMRYRGEPVAVQATCDLYSKAMATLKGLIRPLLPQLFQHLASAFQTTPVTGCLTTLRDAIELFGKESDEELSAILSSVMTTIIQHTCASLANASDPEAQPELLTSYWEMCHRCLVFVPGLLLALPCAPELFESAIACVRHQEFQHTRAVLTFICLFMCPTEAANEYRETSALCLQSSGSRLLRECLSGLASVSPDNLIDHQVELMRVLIEACPTAVATWLRAILANPEGVSFGVIDPRGEAMQTFANLVLQQPALPQGEFQCVASDFSRICRGKLAADHLQKYVRARTVPAA